MLIVQVTMDKRSKRCQETVGSRLLVDALDNLGIGKLARGVELVTKLLGKLAFKQVVQEMFAQIGPTAFVAQDVTQRRGIGSDALAIIETRIGTSTENTGNALGVLAQGTGGAKKVGPHVEPRSKRGKDPDKDSTDDACAHGIAASTIEVDIERGSGGPSSGNLLNHSIKLLYDIILTLMDGIDAPRLHTYDRSVVADKRPIALCTSAISNNYHYYPIFGLIVQN
ncbi:MAG: hypothetical protein U0K26_11835 [Prevotella pectinovora]|uniref:hypothetical protein n=1 Tax=Prevotella pectinovora TaxID=1602169 RepID=UPI002E79E875|nr:hypothetical protein [Prevotella pectinovora]MEE1547908.1 hypothetical protein [Prevotella pectinovora]